MNLIPVLGTDDVHIGHQEILIHLFFAEVYRHDEIAEFRCIVQNILQCQWHCNIFLRTSTNVDSYMCIPVRVTRYLSYEGLNNIFVTTEAVGIKESSVKNILTRQNSSPTYWRLTS